MNLVHLSNLMQNWGFEVHPNHYFMFEGYLTEMLKKDRVMVVWNGPFIEAVILFYLTNDYNKLYKKSMWQVVQDDENGSQLYIDKMICRHWTKGLRENIQRAIQEKFPQIKEAYYHRAPKDRCVKINRRERYELQSTVS